MHHKRSSKSALVLRAARHCPTGTVAQIAAAAGCHPSTARQHLRRSGSAAVRTTAEAESLGVRHRSDVSGADFPTRRMKLLATGSDVGLRRRVAVHPLAPPPVLGRLLLQDRDPAVQIAAAEHPDTPVEALRAVRRGTAERLAHRGRLPEPLVARGASHPAAVVRIVAARSTADPRLLTRLAGDHSPTVSAAAISNPNCPTGMVTDAAASRSQRTRTAAATNPNTPVELLTTLATDGNFAVRAAVAANPNTPAPLLTQLADDHHKVCAAAAANPATPPGTLRSLVIRIRSLATGTGQEIVRAALMNPNCPIRLLRDTAKIGSPYSDRLQAVALNPNCPPELLDLLAFSGDAAVRTHIARHPNCPQELLNRFATDRRNPSVQAAAATNPNCPAVTLHVCANDQDPNVREAANRTLADRAAAAPRP